MKCQGKTKSGRRCQKKVEDGFCSQHESQRPEVQPCARCGPEKGAVQEISVAPSVKTSLCMSCSVAFLYLTLEFVGAEDIDQKVLEFRESF
jgi:hypothetical protein